MDNLEKMQEDTILSHQQVSSARLNTFNTFMLRGNRHYQPGPAILPNSKEEVSNVYRRANSPGWGLLGYQTGLRLW